MAIDIGPGAADYDGTGPANYTRVMKDNPANVSGIIDTVEMWAATNMGGVVVGTFYTTNGDTLKCRDSESIGTVLAGAKRTFTGLTITVVVGDYIGFYFTSGTIESATAGFAGLWYKSGEYIDPGDETTYGFIANRTGAIYGTGIIAHIRTLTESLGLVDNVVKAPSVVKAESLGLVDIYDRTWVIYRTYSEILGLTDTVVSTRLLVKVLTELLGLSDTVKNDTSKMLTEKLGLVDIYSRVWYAHKTLNELLGLADSIQKDIALHPLVEPLGLVDSVVKSSSIIKTESLGLKDSIVKGTLVTKSELLGLADSIQRDITLHPLIESLGLVDNVVKSPSITKSELLGLKDSIVKDTLVTKSELLGLADTVIKGFEKQFNESLGLLDSVTKLTLIIREESLGLEDHISKHVSLHALTEVLGLLDSISYSKNPTILAKLIRKYLQLVDIGGGGEE